MTVYFASAQPTVIPLAAQSWHSRTRFTSISCHACAFPCHRFAAYTHTHTHSLSLLFLIFCVCFEWFTVEVGSVYSESNRVAWLIWHPCDFYTHTPISVTSCTFHFFLFLFFRFGLGFASSFFFFFFVLYLISVTFVFAHVCRLKLSGGEKFETMINKCESSLSLSLRCWGRKLLRYF